ncbi:hypothetical protein KIW84_070299 [Lathyrus oleraceus]|uniref:Uncharacterized protein n=1 Tax=Pisum sativum TaxID=3888 RepID=A0A9D4ZU91_PEA|nr:hypothetical protein KIW84_070299 [Pisum sativum]
MNTGSFVNQKANQLLRNKGYDHQPFFGNSRYRNLQTLDPSSSFPPPWNHCTGYTTSLAAVVNMLQPEEKYILKQPAFDVPFELIELQNFDYALEGIPFQQLTRMPNAVHASTSEAVEATSCLAIEDSSMLAENAIANGRLGGLRGTGILLNNPRHPYGKWDPLLELTLLRTDIRGLAVGCDRQPSLPVLRETLFYAIRMLLARSLSRLSFFPDPSTTFVLLIDSQYVGVVKVEGDVSKLNLDVNNVYECAFTV